MRLPVLAAALLLPAAAAHGELTAAGYQTGDVQRLRRGGEATTTFHCNAPGGVLVEVATSG